MFRLPPDNTYNDIRRKSLEAWIDDLLTNGTYNETCGAKLAKEYIEHLHNEIRMLEDKNAMKDRFLRQMKEENLRLKDTIKKLENQ